MARPTGNKIEASWTSGRYQIFDEIASGGMGVVHFARILGEGSFSRVVAAKRLHADLALDNELVRMMADEARISARVRHPNVASVLDIVDDPSDLLIILEFLEGETLYRLIRASLDRGQRIPPSIACAILCGALLGLHAAHEASDERGNPLHIVHRDVSPQNLMIGADGLVRVLDFGVAKAASRTTVTARGTARGKLTYMAPEQARGLPVDRRADLFAAGIVLWEMLTGERLFAADDPATSLGRLLTAPIPDPASRVPGIPSPLSAVTLRALHREPAFRFATAEHFAMALEEACAPATQRQVASWVMALAGTSILERRARCAEIEALPRPTASVPELSPAPMRELPPIALLQADPTPLPTPSPAPGPEAAPPPASRRSAPPAPTRRRRLALPAACALAAVNAALWLPRLQGAAPAPVAVSAPQTSAAPVAAAPSAPPAAAAPGALASAQAAASALPSGPEFVENPRPDHHERRPRKNASKKRLDSP